MNLTCIESEIFLPRKKKWASMVFLHFARKPCVSVRLTHFQVVWRVMKFLLRFIFNSCSEEKWSESSKRSQIFRCFPHLADNSRITRADSVYHVQQRMCESHADVWCLTNEKHMEVKLSCSPPHGGPGPGYMWGKS